MRYFIFFFFYILAVNSAFADTVQFGAATRCGQTSFELAAIVQHNKEFSVVTDDMVGLKALPKGTHNIGCRFGTVHAQISVRIFEGTNGECMGAGYVEIGDLSVGSSRYPVKGPFNWSCMGRSEMLVKLRVYFKQKELWLERCTAKDWGWEHGYIGFDCKYSAFESKTS